MLKKIYIIEAKLSPEKIKYVTEILDRKSKEYKRVPACNIADYIVTELKSPSRIIRNVKKSTCPVVHLNWLIESVKYEKPLDVKDYLIDVTEERNKAFLDLSRRVDVNALPQQLTWEEVAERRLNRSNHILGQEDKLIKNSALQERNLFMKSYGGRYKSNISRSQPIYNLSLNRTQSSVTDDLLTDSSTPPVSNVPSINNNNLEVRLPMTSKKINISSSFTASSSSHCKVVKKKRHCTTSTKEVIIIKDNEDICHQSKTAKDDDFSIVSSPPLVKESCHITKNNQQSCSAEEINGENSNNVQDNSFSSISSMDSQFSLSKILSL